MNASESSAGADNEAQAETAAQAASESVSLESLGALLEESEPGSDQQSGDEGQGDSGSDQDAKPVKFNDVAGKLGMELDDLYKLQVSISDDGEPVTIEQLKDAYAGSAALDLERIEFEETRTEQQQELMRANQELQEILQALPRNAVKPEVLERIRDKHEAVVTAEREKALKVIPEWRDAEKRAADIKGMAEHLQAYGFPLDYLKQVVNHQQLKYIRDNWQRELRMKKALEAVRAGKPDKRSTSTPAKKAPKKGAVSIKRNQFSDPLAQAFSTVKD